MKEMILACLENSSNKLDEIFKEKPKLKKNTSCHYYLLFCHSYPQYLMPVQFYIKHIYITYYFKFNPL